MIMNNNNNNNHNNNNGNNNNNNNNNDNDTMITTTTTTNKVQVTPLTLMLLNVTVPNNNNNNNTNNNNNNDDGDGDDNKKKKIKNDETPTTTSSSSSSLVVVPPPLNDDEQRQYQNYYRLAFLSRRDKGGSSLNLPGQFDIHPEMYAYGYASASRCSLISSSYRRSYGRLYEFINCESLNSYNNIHVKYIMKKKRYHDILGKYISLQPGTTIEHGEELWNLTCGHPSTQLKSYPPLQVWGFLPIGPFNTMKEMLQCQYLFPMEQGTTVFEFQKKNDDDNHNNGKNKNTNNEQESNNNNKEKVQHEQQQQQQQHVQQQQEQQDYTNAYLRTATFAMMDIITNKLVGWIQLTNDDPANLSVQLELPIVPPLLSSATKNHNNHNNHNNNSLLYSNNKHVMEAIFLLLDRLLVGYGYRRVQIVCDGDDVSTQRYIMNELCATWDGIFRKHTIIMNDQTSRDSYVYSITNSDWQSNYHIVVGNNNSNNNNNNRGIRYLLMKRLYGTTVANIDYAEEQREREAEEQEQQLKEKKQREQQEQQQQQQQALKNKNNNP